MDIDLDRFIAAARLINARITPTRAAGTPEVTLTAADVQILIDAVRRAAFSSVDGNTIMNLLGANRGRPTEQSLHTRELLMITGALHRLVASASRAEKISRGQYPGPMSGSEAVKFMRGRRRF